jgi:hypothetical protein
MIELLVFVFPLMALGGGAYLILRGLQMRAGTPVLLSGRARSLESLRSPLGGEACVYSRVIVEYYQGGHQPWREIFSFEKRPPFSMDGRRVDTGFADFRVRETLSESGYARRDKGMFEQFGDMLAKSQPGEIVRSVATAVTFTPGAAEEIGGSYLDSKRMEALLKLPGAQGRMRPHIRKALRIREYSVPEGALVSVAGGTEGPGGISGKMDAPLVISDGSEGGARESLVEKGAISILIGGALVLLGIGTVVLLIL